MRYRLTRRHTCVPPGRPARRRFGGTWLLRLLVGSVVAGMTGGCVQLAGLDETTVRSDAGTSADGATSADARFVPADCDGDEDGYFLGHPACADLRGDEPIDCDDTRRDVHPGAPVVCGDGVVNNCAELPAEVETAFGVQEIGLVSMDSLFVGEPGDFHNNVSIAARLDATDGPVAVITASESATRVRGVMLDYDDPQSTRIFEPAYPSNVTFANHAAEVVRTDGGFRIGTLGLLTNASFDHAYRPLLADFTSSTSDIGFVMIDETATCQLRGPPEDTVPVTLSGLGESGTLYFEVASTDTSTLRVFYASDEGLGCRDLRDVGIAYNEFGTQLVVSGTLAIGLAGDQGIWTLEDPLHYNDFHTYPLATPYTTQGTLLARGILSGEPVLYAYHAGPSTLAVEVMQCTGLQSCSRIEQHDIPSSVPFQAFAMKLAPLGRGAVLLSSHQPEGVQGASNLALRFLAETGAPLGAGFFLPVAGIGIDETAQESLRWIDIATVPPAAMRPWHDILIAASITREATDQPELRLVRARACNQD